VEGVADRAAPAPLVVRFDYHFDRLLPAKLARAYELLVPDHRWPVSAPAAVAQEADHEHVRRDLRSRVVGSSA
jgi:hypothetical protein